MVCIPIRCDHRHIDIRYIRHNYGRIISVSMFNNYIILLSGLYIHFHLTLYNNMLADTVLKSD